MPFIGSSFLPPNCLEATLGPYDLLFRLMQQYAAYGSSSQAAQCHQTKHLKRKLSAHHFSIYELTDLFFISCLTFSPLPGFKTL